MPREMSLPAACWFMPGRSVTGVVRERGTVGSQSEGVGMGWALV